MAGRRRRLERRAGVNVDVDVVDVVVVDVPVVVRRCPLSPSPSFPFFQDDDVRGNARKCLSFLGWTWRYACTTVGEIHQIHAHT